MGRTRIETAVAASQHAFGNATSIVVARSDAYPDALTGAPLAAKVGGPILLTPTNALPSTVSDEVKRLGATTAYILGDTGAVSMNVEVGLVAAGITTIHRLAGPTRFDTARAVANAVGGTNVYVAQGLDPDPTHGWPDAVAVSGLAAGQQRPILLTTTAALPSATAATLDDLHATAAAIVGGPDVVSEAVATDIHSHGATVTRIAGDTRYGTSALVADATITAGGSAANTWLVTGRNWPDALAAGAASAHDGAVLLLVDGMNATGATESFNWLTAHHADIQRLVVGGGPDVVVPPVAVKAVRSEE
jgi:N-acetylmuramoyl-L-alanine amidase